MLFLAGSFMTTLIQAQLKNDARVVQIKSYFGLAVTAMVFLALASRISFRLTSSSFDPPIVFSPWGTGDGLTTRMDGMGAAFLFIPVLLLIASFWAQRVNNQAILLALAGAAGVVFVAANGISFSYALLFFDALGAVYWLANKESGLALARLFLAIFTTASLMLTGLPSTAEIGGALLAFALWLRIVAFPFVEISGDKETRRQACPEPAEWGDKETERRRDALRTTHYALRGRDA